MLVRADACVHACVCMCVRVHMHACVYALRIVSVDKILRFTNTLIIIYYLSLKITPHQSQAVNAVFKKKCPRCNVRNQFMNQDQHYFRFRVCIAFLCTVVSQDSIPKASA